MTFTKYACWHLDRVRNVMNVEATLPSDPTFMATHQSVPMYRQNLTEKAANIEYDEVTFLQDFLASPDFAFVPVLGDSGTGKSHLIRWLYIQIKQLRSDLNHRILLIPKVKTNLRDILDLLLQDLEGPEFDEYRKRLRATSTTLTDIEARQQLLANLAIAVGRKALDYPANLSEIQAYLVEALPDFLNDPYFRRHWLKDEGIIHRLVIHTLGHRDSVEPVEERRQFALDDLPLSASDLKNASAQARDFFAFLIGNEEVQQETVKWLNRHLDEAIARVLNLGREDLQRLMLDVRRALAKQNIELILLIEDFAKLQGIDREVLESVLARTQQDSKEPLCTMRTALACTTGYFRSLLDTIRGRVEFLINLDIETTDDQILMPHLLQLVTKYLNTVRLDENQIQSWFENGEDRLGENPVPIACADCPFREPCHTGFGEINGIGLYPFTVKALERMHDRIKGNNFNPRSLIKNVLRHTLEYHRHDLERGYFPSIMLREHFGQSTIDPRTRQEIERRDSQNARRREVLLDFWTDGQELRDLSNEIHTAFDLPALGVEIQPTLTPRIVAKVAEAPAIVTVFKPGYDSTPELISQTSFPPAELLPALDMLRAWSNGAQLPQNLAQELRTLLYEAIKQHIDWDAELLLFSQVGKLFDKARNINFQNAATDSEVKSGIKLILPLNSQDLDNTVIALRALLFYNYYKTWKYPGGTADFRAYARQLEKWSQWVLQQIYNRPRQSGELWNPVPAAAELIVIGARMAGCSMDSTEDLVNAVFVKPEDSELDKRSATWRKLFTTITTNYDQMKNRASLRDIIDSRISCTKGGATGFKVIDAAQLIAPLRAVAQGWQPRCEIPEDFRAEEFKAIQQTREQVDLLLSQAVFEERDRQLTVYRRLIAELGSDFMQKDVAEALQQTIQTVRDAGVSGIANLKGVEEAVEIFRGARLRDWINTMKRVEHETEVGCLLSQLSGTSHRPIEVITQFLDQARNFIDKSLNQTQNKITQLEQGGGKDLQATEQAIQQGLSELLEFVEEIQGETLCF
ncbi:MAG TPA: protein DpdH [Trichocoleus sp.]|jgi:hypothetical protein